MPIRVLVVDDNGFVRRTLSTLICASGFEVCGEAEDGKTAIRKACDLRPDLIIMDLVMPQMNGLVASREISEMLPDTHIVLHTLHAVPEIELEAKKNGISRVVPKSQGYSIVSVMRELVNGQPSSASAHAATSLDEDPLTASAAVSQPASQSVEGQSEPNPSGEIARAS